MNLKRPSEDERWRNGEVDDDGFTEVARIPITEEEEKRIVNKPLETFEYFAGWLLDNCEGEVIYEENLQRWLAESEKERLQRWPEAVQPEIERLQRKIAELEGSGEKEPSITGDSINRKLHENKPLAIAIGRGITESLISGFWCTIEKEYCFGYAPMNKSKFLFEKVLWAQSEHERKEQYRRNKACLPDSWEIPKQIIQWMEEYKIEMELKEKPITTCTECGKTWEGETACTSKHTDGLYCSAKCADRADLKAEYAKAKEEEANGGLVVKVFWKTMTDTDAMYTETDSPEWLSTCDYQLRYYSIDWQKVLAWSYVNGEFIECEFRQAGAVGWTRADLVGKYGKYFINDKYTTKYENCRLPKGTKPRDEWLKEEK